jgi:glycosyltransferase involved in cell wall biosynthesis
LHIEGLQGDSQEVENVAIVIGQLSHGGAERQVVELALGLAAGKQYAPVVICYSRLIEPFGRDLAAEGVHTVYPRRRLKTGIGKALWIRRALRQNEWSIAYGILNPSNIYCRLVCLGTGRKFVASVRGVPELRGTLRVGLRWACRGAAGIIANSLAGKEWIVEQYGADPSRVTVVPNSVSLCERNQAARGRIRRALGIEASARVVGTVALLKQAKRPEFFMEVALCMKERFSESPAHYVWVGDGVLRDSVEKHLHSLPPSLQGQVHFVGAQSSVADWLSAFDVFVLTSGSEGLPNAMMEAMAIGLPCLATDVPGTRDLMRDGENGLLAPNEVGPFCTKLRALLERRDLRDRLGVAARAEMAAHYSREQLAERTSAVFDRVLEK